MINDSIYFVYADKQQNVWIGTVNGLDKMDVKSGKFTHYFFDKKGNYNTGDNIIYYICEDNSGRLWVGTVNGLNQLDEKTGRFKRYLESETIVSILPGSNGNTWVGSNRGLYKYDSISGVFESITNPSTGKQFPMPSSITEDNNKNIWFDSHAGITKYNDRQKEASTYGMNAGVNGSNFNIGAAFRDHAGHLYCGDETGYFAFNPEDLAKHSKAPEVLLSELRINNKIILPANSSPLQQALWKTKELSLTHDQNVFSFAFAAIDYSNPSANKHL